MTLVPTPAPPTPFPPITPYPLQAGTRLHRIHASAFAPNAFNPGLGRPSRFAPLRSAAGTVIPTAYFATTLDCAAHETVFHEVPHDAAVKTVPYDELRDRDHAELDVTSPLTLCPLFQPDLARLGVARVELIDTRPGAYAETARWAATIHAADPMVQGLVWTSRRCDPDLALVLFGDRVAPGTLAVRGRAALTASPALAALRAIGARAGITLVV
jgi:hypothetical protein